MSRLSVTDAARLRDIGAELGTVRLDGPSAWSVVLPQVRVLLRADCAGVYRPKETRAPAGWAFDLVHFDRENEAQKTDISRRVARWASRAAPFRSNVLRPPVAQRNNVMLPIAELTREAYEQLDLYRDVVGPSGLGEHRQVRVLICEGDSLLAWFGAFSIAVDARDRRVLAALVPAMRQRLSFDRRIQDVPRKSGALQAALELLAMPTFVVGGQGTVHETNAAGRALFDSSREVPRCLRDAVLRRPCAFDVALTPIRGEAGGFIATIHPPSDELGAKCALATLRWTLTPRQGEVLARLADGLANAAIAATLGIALRTVEFHVTALFDAAGVQTRSALVASLLTIR